MMGNVHSLKDGNPSREPLRTEDGFPHIELDEFDDEEIRPVVLLSPKPKASEQHKLDRDFMRDLERRLEKEDEKSSEKPPEDPYASDENLIKER
jgi:hypothetical protein